MQLKQNRKTPNLPTRDKTKRTSKDLQVDPALRTKTSFIIHEKKKASNKSIAEQIQTQKEITRAEYLTEQEQKKIAKEAQKQVKKKVKGTQTQLQSNLISVLEQQCNKLGQQVEKERYQSQKKQFQIEHLRKNVALLNQRLQKVYEEHESLANNNNYGNMEKQQLKQELKNMKIALKRKQDFFQYQVQKLKAQISQLTSTSQKNDQKIIELQSTNKNLMMQNEELQEELEEKKMEAQYIRQHFQSKKKEWDNYRLSMENENAKKLEKRGEKISKFQGEVEKLGQKLRDEQVLRKKQIQKYREVEKEVTKKNDIICNLENELIALKKRNNDLSILKSSNNAILNEKVTKLVQENKGLRQQIQYLKGESKKSYKFIQEQKPILFGAEDYD